MVTNMYTLGKWYQYKFFLERDHSPKNTLGVLAMGQICQRRASVGDAPRISVPAEAAPCMPKKHDPKRYANDYSRPALLGHDPMEFHRDVMFVLAPTPRTIINVCSICSKSPFDNIFFNVGSVVKLDAPATTCRFDHIEDSDDDKEPPPPEEEPRHPEEPNNPTDEQRRDLKVKFPGGSYQPCWTWFYIAVMQ